MEKIEAENQVVKEKLDEEFYEEMKEIGKTDEEIEAMKAKFAPVSMFQNEIHDNELFTD